MVDVMGHIAFGLLFALPAWFLWTGRASVAFIALTTTTAMLPDVDLVLSTLFPTAIHHHGVTHTILFVVCVSVVVGVAVAALFGDRIDRWTRGERFDRTSMVAFVTGAFMLGGLSHLVADMLSAPDIAPPVNPFWPLFAKPWSVDVLWYNSVWINGVFLTGILLTHVVIGIVLDPLEHRYRVEATRD